MKQTVCSFCVCWTLPVGASQESLYFEVTLMVAIIIPLRQGAHRNNWARWWGWGRLSLMQHVLLWRYIDGWVVMTTWCIVNSSLGVDVRVSLQLFKAFCWNIIKQTKKMFSLHPRDFQTGVSNFISETESLLFCADHCSTDKFQDVNLCSTLQNLQLRM